MAGFKIFFSEPPSTPLSPQAVARGGVGNCIACHAPPLFSDFQLHNAGTAQQEYDLIHGEGAFAALFVPSLSERSSHPEQYLPATRDHPAYLEPFRAIPSASYPGLTDLGVWNVFAHPDMPAPQAKIRSLLCDEQAGFCPSDDVLLPLTLAQFKTPGLRDLGRSAPSMHNGQLERVEDVVRLYIKSAEPAGQGRLRNGASALQGIAVKPADIAPLVAFLAALDEDYE